VAHAVRAVLATDGLNGAVKTSGAKGLHIFVPVVAGLDPADTAAAARALAARVAREAPGAATTEFMKDDRQGKVFVDSTRVGSSTVAAVYSPRRRPGVPVSFPVGWHELDAIVRMVKSVGALGRLAGRDPWAESMPPTQELPSELIAEGHTIPVPRVAAMHEGKRRARAKRSD
jgi:bifunctional non-homologous end joining protein LigD